MTRLRRAVLGLMLLGALASCGVGPQERAYVFRGDQVPSGILDRVPIGSTTSAGPSTTQASITAYRLFFVRSGALYEVNRTSNGLPSPSEIIAELTQGPTTAEQAGGFRSALGTASVVSAVRQNGALAQVDLARTFVDIPRADQVLALGQITLTLTDRADILRVQFTMANVLIEVPKGNGPLTSEPVGAEDFRDLLRLPTGPAASNSGASGASGTSGATGTNGNANTSGATGPRNPDTPPEDPPGAVGPTG